MTIEFQLARAFTAQSKWADPKVIRGGKSELTAEDVRAAVSMGLSEHPFAFHALMWKWCDDPHSRYILQELLNDFALLKYHDAHPNEGIKGSLHWELVKYAVEFFRQPEVGRRMGDKGVAGHLKIHMDTFNSRYKQHFNRVTGALFELELTAMQDYKRVMRRDD